MNTQPPVLRSRVRRHRRRPIRRRQRGNRQPNALAETLNAATGTFIAYGVARLMSAVARILEGEFVKT